MLETRPTLGDPSMTVAPRKPIRLSSEIWMPSMAEVATSRPYLKGCHNGLGPDPRGHFSRRYDVVTATPPRFSMMLAEQYFSMDSSIARFTFVSFRGPRRTYVMWLFVNTPGGFVARSASISIR